MKRQRAARTLLIRTLTVPAGAIDVIGRLFSVNRDAWWIGVPLAIVETYSPIDCVLLITTAAAARRIDYPHRRPLARR